MTKWKQILEFEGWYLVSDKGQVRRDMPGCNAKVGGILKPTLNIHGYLHNVLNRNGFRKTPLIHNLVTRAFLGERPKGLDVHHKDGNKTNNCLENLEYTTRSKNILHAYKTGLKISSAKTHVELYKKLGYKLHIIRKKKGKS